jgi:hypothetical protein
MPGPTSNWVCKKCATSNDAGSQFCIGCGCSPEGTPIELEPDAVKAEKRPFSAEDDFWAWIFPEGYIAIAALIASPFLLLGLLLKGEFFRAFVWFCGIGSMGCLMAYGFREGLRFLVHLSFLGIVLTVFLVWVR